MTLGGVGISMVGRNPGNPSVASAVPQSYDGSVCRVPVLPAACRRHVSLWADLYTRAVGRQPYR